MQRGEMTRPSVSLKIISNPVQYGHAGAINPLTEQGVLEQDQPSAQSPDQYMHYSADLEAGKNKFAVFEPDSLVMKAHTDAMRDDPVAKLNDAKKL